VVSASVRRALFRRKNAVYHFMDTDRNDMVTLNEFCKGVAMAGVRPIPARADLVNLFELCDVNTDGRVSFHEFKSTIEKLQPPPTPRRAAPMPPKLVLPYASNLNALRSELRAANDQASAAELAIRTLADITLNSKVCTCRQIKETIKALGMTPSRRDFVAMLRRYDPDGKNEIRYESALRDFAIGVYPRAPVTHRPMRPTPRRIIYHQHQLHTARPPHHP